jgi:UDP-glucose:tetrahydrobiopterin glucosyltransferase
MRIAIMAPLVTPIREPQQGGSQAVVADLARGLTRLGHQVDVYAAAGSAIAGVSVIDTGIDSKALTSLLWRADRPSGPPTPAGDAAFRIAFEAAKQRVYDVVHNHAFDPPAVRFAAMLESPVIHTLHLPPDLAMAAALMESLESPNPPTIATVSTASAAAWRRLVQVNAVLRNGVPVDQIGFSADAGDTLLFVGRYSPEKGAADAIAIARQAGLPISLYGEPYDAEYARVEVEPHRGEPGVNIQGAVNRAEIWKVMARSRALLCPARWDEPFGMAAAEAQAAGTPVIAYDRGALGEVVRDKQTGFLVRTNDVAGAARCVNHLAIIKRADCRQHAEANLSLEATLSAHERLYQQVAARSRGHSHA